MSKNYYEQKIDEIKLLIKKNELNEAIELLKKEMDMPYIPEIFEVKFTNLMDDIKAKLPDDKKNNMISREVLMNYLLSDNPDQVVIALELLREHNLRYEKDVLKRRIETWPQDKNIFKAYLFEAMIEQNIDVEINFNNIILNPAKQSTILVDPKVQETQKELENIFQKNPQALAIAEEEFQRFLLYTYPKVPQNPKEIAIDFHKIVKSMFDKEILLTNRQKEIKEMLLK